MYVLEIINIVNKNRVTKGDQKSTCYMQAFHILQVRGSDKRLYDKSSRGFCHTHDVSPPISPAVCTSVNGIPPCMARFYFYYYFL